MVMVKPGMPYLDIVPGSRNFGVPTFAYQVSGEYAMLNAASPTAGSTVTGDVGKPAGFKRAGADGILTYFAVEAAKLFRRP